MSYIHCSYTLLDPITKKHEKVYIYEYDHTRTYTHKHKGLLPKQREAYLEGPQEQYLELYQHFSYQSKP